MKIPRSKGMKDWLPGETALFRLIEGKFRGQCLKWGYQEVRTPSIESLHLFTSAGTLTPSMLNRVYSFLDWDGWSGERVVLRPDGTIPIARLYIDQMTELALARLFYISNIFIFEETGKESRERWQCGAELIGTGTPLADTELIALALEVIDDLGIRNVEMKLSHAGLIKALLSAFGLSPQEQMQAFDRILDGDVDTLAELQLRNPELEDVLPAFLGMKGKSAGFRQNLRAVSNITEMRPHLDDFLGIVSYLESLGYDYQIDIASGAGFEYYSGMIFQLFVGETKIGGGGRYDNLIPAMGGQATPASGFALYLDRLAKLLETSISEIPAPENILVSIRTGEDVPLAEIFQVARRIRASGCAAELDLTNRRTPGIKWVLEIGAKSPRFTLTDLKRGRKAEYQDIGDILKLLEAEGAAQNRIT